MNCTRPKLRSSASASDATSSVLASPGTPTRSACPRAKSATSISSMTCSCPTTRAAMASCEALARSRRSPSRGARRLLATAAVALGPRRRLPFVDRSARDGCSRLASPMSHADTGMSKRLGSPPRLGLAGPAPRCAGHFDLQAPSAACTPAKVPAPSTATPDKAAAPHAGALTSGAPAPDTLVPARSSTARARPRAGALGGEAPGALRGRAFSSSPAPPRTGPPDRASRARGSSADGRTGGR